MADPKPGFERTVGQAPLVIESAMSRRGVPGTGRRESGRPMLFSLLGSLGASGEDARSPWAVPSFGSCSRTSSWAPQGCVRRAPD